MKKILPFLFFVSFLASSCSNDDCPSNSVSCGTNAILVANETLDAIQTNNYQIQSVTLSGNCLEVTIASSGCNADNWTMNLFSNTTFFDSFPLQRFAKIEVITNEACLAVLQKTVYFDLQPFQIEGQDSVTIMIEGWNTPVNYQY
jgi:SAM-dependent MidA family methyltransferase